MTEKPQNKNLNGLSTKNDSYEEHADKCPVCGSVHLSGSSETGIACDDCGYEEQE